MEHDSGRALLLPGPAAGPGRVRHQALQCSGGEDCFAPVLAFARAGIMRDEPVWVGLSATLGRRLGRVLGSNPGLAYFDMTELGRNPGRIIAAMLDFAAAHAGARLRYLSEPVTARQSAAERAEALRHEALVETALAGRPALVLCVYDAARLGRDAVDRAELTHPEIIAAGQPRASPRASPRYPGHPVVPPPYDEPPPPAPGRAARLGYRDDLAGVRALVAQLGQEAGLPPGRAADLVLAVSEVAANTLRHTGGAGELRVWREPAELVCEIADTGVITDPLAGRRRPAADGAFGQGGLWVVNQVCDLVQLRSGPGGTTIRMHIRR